jgi:hypothetical protein
MSRCRDHEQGLTPLSKAPRHHSEAPGFAFSRRGTSDKVLALYGQMKGKHW